ncbi:unnamed protein product [Symbiodinium microadriaticum]|nr:unnamed protein product [Symbiodinium microadriaticum]
MITSSTKLGLLTLRKGIPKQCGGFNMHYKQAVVSRGDLVATAAMVLLDRGCAADVQDTAGRTALHLAVCSKEPQLCKLLLAKSPELAARKDLQGRSPLAYAVLHPAQPVAEQCTRLLLAGLADVNAEDIFGFDALHYARKAGAEGAAALLKAVQTAAETETVPQRLQQGHTQDDIPYWKMLLDQRDEGALPKFSATQEYHPERSAREEVAHSQHAHAHAERLRQELTEQNELLEAAKLEVKEGQLREKELRTELVVQQNATTGADQEAYGEGFPNSLGHRVLRAGRQLAQKSEEFRTAEAAARSLAGRNAELEAELQASKDLLAEIQVEELELHRKLDRELQNRGEEESWRFLAEEDRRSAAAVREMLEQRLEDAEKSAASLRLREIDSLSKLEGDLAQHHEAELAQMRQEFETAKEEAGTSWNSIATVRAEAKRNVEAEAEICRHELQSARLAQEKQRQLEQQLHQGRQLSSLLEQEASRLKEEVCVRDEQWQALFRHYPTVGHAFFSSAATADGGGKKTIHWAVLNMKHPKSTTSLSLGREALLSSHREEMKEIFDLLDADGSGSIDPKEIRMQMQALGFEADNTTIYQLISDLDGDGSQNLEFEEFLKILKDMQVHAVGYATRDNMQEVFDYLDDLEPQQRDKKIDVTNLQRIAQVLGDNISDAEIEVMIEHADRDGKGFVTAEDFYVLMADEARRVHRPPAVSLAVSSVRACAGIASWHGWCPSIASWSECAAPCCTCQ